MKKLLLGLGLFAALLSVLLILIGKTPPLPALPQPNGYDDFLKASRAVVSFDADKSAALAVEVLRDHVAANQKSLTLVRAGLGRECRVALNFSSNDLTNHIAQIGAFKALAHAFIAEGGLAEREQRPADAAQAYLDTVRFGQECCRGGVLIDALVGMAMETLGCRALEPMVDKLPAGDCREVSRQLEAILAKAEPLDSVFQQERLWARHNHGLAGQISLLMTRSSQERMRQGIRKKVAEHQRELRQLQQSLAARAAEPETPPKR
jgi:hypothetical protein